MAQNREKASQLLFDTAWLAGIAGVAIFLSLHKFSEESRAVIRKRSNGSCEDCRRPYDNRNKPTASHINHYYHHREQKAYDNPENGRSLCRFCEFIWHLRHSNNSHAIGLTQEVNDCVIKGWYCMMTQEQKRRLASEHPRLAPELQKVLKRLEKKH